MISKKAQKVLNDLELNHNHSWAQEVIMRNKNNLNCIAIKYRGVKITYQEMFDEATKYAKALKALGYDKGDEVPVCMSNTPEFAYMMLAVSMIGGILNSFPEWADKDYLKFIINHSKSKNVFVTDKEYPLMKEALEESNASNIVVFSVTDSLYKNLKGEPVDPYKEIDDKFYPFVNRINEIEDYTSKNVMDVKDFKRLGDNISMANVHACVSLYDPFTITYSSGSTGRPKAILQPVRSYMTISRFKDHDVSGMPKMRNMTILAHIPTYTHVVLTTSYSDVFFEQCTVAPEPIYQKEAYPYTLLINEPNQVCSSPGFNTYLANLLTFDENWKHVKFPYLAIPTVTGEELKPGQEKYFNKVAREHDFGIDKLPRPLGPVSYSIGGGTSETSGIFFTLFKEHMRKLSFFKHQEIGLQTAGMALVDVIDENGNSCEIGQEGMIIVSSPCNMNGYYYEKELDKDCFMYDYKGNKWLKVGAYGIKLDNKGNIRMAGRLHDDFILGDIKIPVFKFEDVVQKDTKNILAAHAFFYEESNELVIFVEQSPFSKENFKALEESIYNRLNKVFNKEVMDNVIIKQVDPSLGVPLAPSGKADRNALKALYTPSLEKAMTLKLEK